MAALQIEAVHKRYGAVEVVPPLDLTVDAGEFIVLLGPSGCGKSTLMRMIAGLEPVSGGRIRIGGQDVTGRDPGARGVAMVFQHYALYPHMSVAENLAFGLRNLRTPAAEIARRVADAARMLELEALLQRRPAQLSGGQRQRVAIGRAVVKQPQLFLFDEPLSNLDAALRARTRIELARLHRRLGATMVFVTHDQVEAMTLADRIVVMNRGRIEQIGSPMAVYRQPASRFVAGFVGSPAMNLLPAVVAAGDGGRLLAAGASVPLAGGFGALVPGAALSLGVRAEDLRPDPQGAWAGEVEVVERLGERTLLYVRLADGQSVVAEAARDATTRPGETLRLRPDPQHLHLFDATGRRLPAATGLREAA
ncbi:MAG: hypothetical protein RL223_2336 [Pseudomonadota bacterium]|jgi:multiple sugar transport system ATP-binding protein